MGTISDAGPPEKNSASRSGADEEPVDNEGTIDPDPAGDSPKPLESRRDRSTGLPATQAIYGPPS